MRISTVLVLFFSMLACNTCGALRRKPGAGKYSDHKINVADRERSYIRYAPAGGTPRAVLILLHGGGGKASSMIRQAVGMPELADRHGILLLYPEGVGGHWNDGRGDISEAARTGVDDVGFMRALVAEEAGKRDIRRVFAAGMSNGGMMAQRIACDLSDVIAGVASVAANLPVELEKNCRPAQPVRVMFIAGMADPIVPYGGGPIKVLRNERGVVLSIEESLGFWRERLQCRAGSDEVMTANSVRRKYSCPAGALTLIAVKNGGHAWPGGSPYMPEFVIGKTSDEFSASEKIVEVLLQF